MKNLFVITTVNQKEKEETQNISPTKIKSEKEKSNLDLDLTQTRSESTNLCQSPKTDSCDYSRKYSLNVLSTENSISANLNNILEADNKNNEKKDFLGKKTKFHFDIIKTCGDSNLKKNIDSNLENDLNIELNNYKELFTIQKPKLNAKFIKKKIPEKKKHIKEGRWTMEERIKFIEALIENGKKWKNIQDYIGSRTCAQTRSHAQKFLLKLKSISNDEFNFKKDSIKNLGDILEEIKKKKGISDTNDINAKKYIIDILLNLSNLNDTINENTDNKNINTNEISSEKDNDSMTIYEKENINEKEQEKENLKNNVIIDNQKEKNINVNEEKNTSNKDNELKVDIQERDQKLNEKNNTKINSKNDCRNYNNNYINFSEPIDQKLVFDDGFAFYINNNSIYNFNNISFYIKEYNFIRNIERSKFINRNFFS
jgi:SHAQKYF class myb-like DNA-binding protein